MSRIPKCLNCGHEVDAGDEFCAECGEEVMVIRCIGCGSIIQENITSCPECGGEDLERIKPESMSDEEYWDTYMGDLNKFF